MQYDQLSLINIEGGFNITEHWPEHDVKNMKFVMRSMNLVWSIIEKNNWQISKNAGIYCYEAPIGYFSSYIDLYNLGKLEDYSSYRKIWPPAGIFKQIYSMNVSHLARILNITGPCYTISESCNAIAALLDQIQIDFREERIEQAVLFCAIANNNIGAKNDLMSLNEEWAFVSILSTEIDIDVFKKVNLDIIQDKIERSLF